MAAAIQSRVIPLQELSKYRCKFQIVIAKNPLRRTTAKEKNVVVW